MFTIIARVGGGRGRGGGGANRGSSLASSAVAAKELARGSRSGSPPGGTSGRGRRGERGGRVNKQARRTAGGAAVNDVAGGHAYGEILEYLSSQPERALKGVGPKRGQQLANLGTGRLL